MFSTILKESTSVSHQKLEKIVVSKLKDIRSESDYAALLIHFYAYFSALEKAIAPFIDDTILAGFDQRRKAERLSTDISALGEATTLLPTVQMPQINTLAQALGAMYVMEGSVMGGPIIIGLLQKAGIQKGFSFFGGYGDKTHAMWATFIQLLNEKFTTPDQQKLAIQTANETFENFALTF
ncbi:MAG: biliverdin-producing heme oxygenase [Pedobacter sp.]|nr:biliverdin-producing heme oxygenase [Pedobacter sp.]MDQ8051425.1 biliverdin-producing heme oxygenase [Pedobacter sp.]